MCYYNHYQIRDAKEIFLSFSKLFFSHRLLVEISLPQEKKLSRVL